MQLEQHFLVAVAPARVWAAFHDPELLVSCLPGASLRGPAENGALPLLFKVKLGPIAAAFAGSGELTLDEGARSGVFAGQAADGKSNSRVKGQAAFDLTPADAGTRVGVNVTFSITGSLAQFSREGIVRALADQLTRQFADNLQAALAQDALAFDDVLSASPAPIEGLSASPPPIEGLGAPPSAAMDASPSGSEPTSASASMSAAEPIAAPPPPIARARPLATDEAPALNLFTLLGAMMRDYWRKLLNRKPTK